MPELDLVENSVSTAVAVRVSGSESKQLYLSSVVFPSVYRSKETCIIEFKREIRQTSFVFYLLGNL